MPTLEYIKHTKTNPKNPHGQRLSQIAAILRAIYETYRPFAAIVRERGFSHHAATTQALFKVVGIVDFTFADDGEIVEIAPTSVKKTLTGDGKADKAVVAIAVRQRLRLPGDYAFATDDESDAAAVCLAYLINEGLIDK